MSIEKHRASAAAESQPLACFALAASLFAACSPSVQPWERSELVGYSYELKDHKAVEIFIFQNSGDVVCTIGQRDGPVCGPILRWEIATNGVLIIKDDEHRSQFVLSKTSLDNSKATVLSSGKRQTFTRSKSEPIFYIH